MPNDMPELNPATVEAARNILLWKLADAGFSNVVPVLWGYDDRYNTFDFAFTSKAFTFDQLDQLSWNFATSRIDFGAGDSYRSITPEAGITITVREASLRGTST